jgi:Tol biopolymer transport system component
MIERWRTELRNVDRLRPEDDLVDRALDRPRRPLPGPRPWSKAAIIIVALLVPAAATYGVVAAIGRDADAPRRVTQPDHQAAATVTNGDLVYTKHAPGWGLFTLDPATGDEHQITSGVRDYGSDWSPDGTKIVYDSEASGSHGIWVVDADGSNPTQLTDDGAVPAWSPDGTTIAFARSDPGTVVGYDGVQAGGYSIYLMNTDGTDVRRLTPAGNGDYSPAWSPDGSKIAFLRGGAGLQVMNADGTDVQQLIGPDVELLSAPAWSPDGTSIAVAINGVKDGTQGGIALVATDGSNTVTFVPGTRADWPDYVTNPAWSPDGAWIAYVDGYPGTITVVRPDGSEPHTLSVDPGNDSIEELAWGVAPAGS